MTKVVKVEYLDDKASKYRFRLNCKHLWLKKRKTVTKTVSSNGIGYEAAKNKFLDSVKIPRNYRATSLSGTIIID